MRRQVPVEREEVIVERERVEQPISEAEAATRLQAGQREVIVPSTARRSRLPSGRS